MLGLDFDDDGRAFIPLDIDGDGDLDLPIASLQGLRLMENKTAPSNFIRLKLAATEGVRQALGAEVIVHSAGTKQWDYVKASAGFQSQPTTELHFGLGASKTVDRIDISWKDGKKQTLSNLSANRRYLIRQGDEAQDLPIPRWSEASRPKSSRKLDLNIEVPTLKNLATPIKTTGRATLVNFWAPWCKPCQKELPQLAKLSKRFAGANFVGISVERKDLASIKKTISTFQLDYDQRIASDAVLESFFGSGGELPLPSTFVFDQEGQLRRAYYRPFEYTELESVLADIIQGESDVQLVLALAEHHHAKNNHSRALEIVSKALQETPDSIELLLALGKSQSFLNQAAASLATFEKITSISPEHAFAWYAQGVVLKSEQSEKALEAFRRAVQFAPKNKQFLTSLGAAYFRAKQMQKARKVFTQLVQSHPNDPQAWVNLAKARKLSGAQNAKEALRQALRLDPNHSEAKALLSRFAN